MLMDLIALIAALAILFTVFMDINKVPKQDNLNMPVSLDRELILYKIYLKNSIYPSISNNNMPTCFQSLSLD